jgi:dipeptidyl aminopeptidase/acylaminoacyl peptidase
VPVVKIELPYGTWPSPVTPEMLTSGAVGLVDVWVDGDVTVWLESRPAEGGRLQLVVLDDGERRDLLPDGFSARSGVHEYGGGAAWVEDATAWFVNWSDQRLYRMPIDATGQPLALTPEPESARAVRYADMRLSPDRRWLVCVRERHVDHHDVRNEVVLLDAARPGEPTLVYDAHDFVMSPRFVAADRLRFVAWNHPDMPWNSTSLMECAFDVTTGATGVPRPIASGASFMQPVGDLAISDRRGWWNLWSIDSDGDESPIDPIDAEIGGPAWVFGERAYVVLGDGRRVYSTGADLFVDGLRHTTEVASLSQFAAAGTTVTAIACYVDRHPAIVRFDANDPSSIEIVASPAALMLDPEDISVAQQIEYPTVEGHAYAWYYPPTNSRYGAPRGDRPPLVTMIHGGPTSRAEPTFSIARQFWTSRGFAVVDVNHRGSTGFGTEFRDLLDGNWGVVDVEDCFAAAEWLAGQGLVDGSKMVIRGGSAGGFTVLSCLAFGDVFAGGASLYGVADLSLLARDTHKFEARYLDRLVGAWPDSSELYQGRSPINHLDRFTTPLIVFQGLDDMVVPPSQSAAIVDALAHKGVDHEYHVYEGEGHGFRRAETIVDQLTKELAFYQRVLGLDG